MYSAFMVAIQIRDVPDDVRNALAQQAEAGGQSLQRYLLGVLTSQARRARNLDALERFAAREDGVRSRPGETAADLAAVRDTAE